jgi:mannose-6-phosphate isomerase-like protein (cupin superfamily)
VEGEEKGSTIPPTPVEISSHVRPSIRHCGANLGGNELMNRPRGPVHIEPKGWGREVWIANNELYCGKILEIRKGKRCSLHYHSLKTETFYLRSGHIKLRLKESADSEIVEEHELLPGDCMDVNPGLVHQMEALEDSELFEFSTQHFESDSYRLLRGD